MKYDVENLQNIKAIGAEISGMLQGELTDLVNRSINIKSELELADKVLLTPERTDKDIARHAGLVKQYCENFVKQRDTICKIRRLANLLTMELEMDNDNSVKIIQAK